MANTKEYTIKINGLQESVNAVESLNKQLNTLEQKMKTLSSSKVSTGGGSSTKANAALSEEEQVQKEINKLKQQGAQLDAKIVAAQDEIYKRVDATKQLYKETIADQKALAAQERLSADAYSNTMQGMKSKLADLKAVINTTDLGDGDSIKKMTQEANELAKKLKEMEEAYGQFGRNVGNYKDAANGFKGLTIEVAGVSQNFDNAKQAAKELGNELKTLQVKKDRGMFMSEEEVKRFEELPEIVAQLKSSINDAGKPLDDLMDAMQSIVAIAQTTKGFSALFGIDGDKIERSIQKLVALQNAMKGIETISKQLQEKQGIGKWISSASSAIDSFAAKITKTEKAAKGLSLTLKALSGVALVATIIAITKSLSDLNKKQKDVQQASEEGLKVYVKTEAELSMLETKLNNFNGTKKQEKKLVEELNSKYGTSLGQYKSLKGWKDALITKGKAYCQVLQKEAEMQAILNLYTENYIKLQKAKKEQEKGNQDTVDLILKALDGEATIRQVLASIMDDFKAPFSDNLNEYNDYLQEIIDELDENGKEYLDKLKKLQGEVDKINEDSKLNDYSDQIDKNTTKTKKALTDAEKEYVQAKISAMKEGLNKTITQLEEERKARLAKLDKNSKDYKKQEALINAVYNERIVKAEQEWAKKLEKINRDAWIQIKNDAISIQKQTLENIKSMWQNEGDLDKLIGSFLKQGIGSYGIQGKNQLSPSTLDSLGFTATFDTSKIMGDIRKLIELQRELTTVENKVKEIEARRQLGESGGELEMQYDRESKALKKLTEELDEYNKYLAKTYKENDIQKAREKLIEENYTKDLAQQFKQRMSAIETYWYLRATFSETEAQEIYLREKQIIDDAYEVEKEETKNHYRELIDVADNAYQAEIDFLKGQLKAKMLTKQEYLEQEKAAEAEYSKNVLQIQKQQNDAEDAQEKKHEQNLIRIKEEKDDKRKELNKQYYAAQLQELRDFQTALSDLESKQPVMTSFGFTALQKTFDNNKTLLSGYEELAKKIINTRKNLNKYYAEGWIDKDVYESSIREIDRFSAELGNKMDEVKQKMSFTAQAQVLVGEISQYASQLGSALNSMLQSLADYTDQQYENSINDIEKQIDEQEELYKKQEELVNQHKSKLDEIEDELATSRGDRRQHLIDQLNAEMDAQRAALAEQKRIEKEKKALEDKKDREEKDRKEAQKKIAMTSAVINGATAFMNALAQQPIWLGIALAAMTAAMTAVQIATISSAKYASGGVIEGNSHARGGVDVYGNGRVEVEGGEFITNKRTTSQNVDLLEYINSKKKKVNLDDMIEFYSNGNARKSIVNMSPRKKFAEGGIVPTMSTEYTFDDRLLVAFEDYSNRPVVVSVVDINNKQDQVRRVQTLAGL